MSDAADILPDVHTYSSISTALDGMANLDCSQENYSMYLDADRAAIGRTIPENSQMQFPDCDLSWQYM